MLNNLLLILHLVAGQPQFEAKPDVVLASHTISLEDRYSNEYVNNVFKDNILLALKYTSGEVKTKNDIDWSAIESPFHFEFSLKPGEEFAFHENTLPDYSINVVNSTNSHFNWAEGYKSDGYLVGDGVCHLASLINWAAKDAKLKTYAPANHNFAIIPEVPKEYGVAILAPNPNENLYIVNNKEKTVTFKFDYDGKNLKVDVTEEI